MKRPSNTIITGHVALLVLLASIDGSTPAKIAGLIYGEFNFGYRNYQCNRERNCARNHDSGPIYGISESDCHARCRSDPKCVSSLHWAANDPGTCWLDYSLVTVCRSNDAEWTEAEGFSYCVATCSHLSVANGVVEYSPSDIVVMPAAKVVATLKCSAGFSPSGSATAKCQTNGLWSESLSCKSDEDDTGLKILIPG